MSKPNTRTRKCIKIVRRFDHEFSRKEYEDACDALDIIPVSLHTLKNYNVIEFHEYKKIVKMWTPHEFINWLQTEVFGEDCYGWYPDIEYDDEHQCYVQYVHDHTMYTVC